MIVEMCSAGDAHSAVLTKARDFDESKVEGYGTLPGGLPPILQIRKVFCFGRGAHGRLGNGTNRNQPLPVMVKKFPPSVTGAQPHVISCGGAHTVLLAYRYRTEHSANGVIVPPAGASKEPKRCLAYPFGIETFVCAWGYGTNGQLGTGYQMDTFIPVRCRILPKTEIIVNVTAGRSWTIAQTVGGSLYVCGKGLRGQLGFPNEEGSVEKRTFSFAPRQLDTFGAYLKVDAGYAHNLGIYVPKKQLDLEMIEEISKRNPLFNPLNYWKEQLSLKKRESIAMVQFTCCKRTPGSLSLFQYAGLTLEEKEDAHSHGHNDAHTHGQHGGKRGRERNESFDSFDSANSHSLSHYQPPNMSTFYGLGSTSAGHMYAQTFYQTHNRYTCMTCGVASVCHHCVLLCHKGHEVLNTSLHEGLKASGLPSFAIFPRPEYKRVECKEEQMRPDVGSSRGPSSGLVGHVRLTVRVSKVNQQSAPISVTNALNAIQHIRYAHTSSNTTAEGSDNSLTKKKYVKPKIKRTHAHDPDMVHAEELEAARKERERLKAEQDKPYVGVRYTRVPSAPLSYPLLMRIVDKRRREEERAAAIAAAQRNRKARRETAEKAGHKKRNNNVHSSPSPVKGRKGGSNKSDRGESDSDRERGSVAIAASRRGSAASITSLGGGADRVKVDTRYPIHEPFHPSLCLSSQSAYMQALASRACSCSLYHSHCHVLPDIPDTPISIPNTCDPPLPYQEEKKMILQSISRYSNGKRSKKLRETEKLLDKEHAQFTDALAYLTKKTIVLQSFARGIIARRRVLLKKRDLTFIRRLGCTQYVQDKILKPVMNKFVREYDRFREEVENNDMEYEDLLTKAYELQKKTQKLIIGMKAVTFGVQYLVAKASIPLPIFASHIQGQLTDYDSRFEEPIAWYPSYTFSWTSLRELQLRLHPRHRIPVDILAQVSQYYPRGSGPSFGNVLGNLGGILGCESGSLGGGGSGGVYKEGVTPDPDVTMFIRPFLFTKQNQRELVRVIMETKQREEKHRKMVELALKRLQRKAGGGGGGAWGGGSSAGGGGGSSIVSSSMKGGSSISGMTSATASVKAPPLGGGSISSATTGVPHAPPPPSGPPGILKGKITSLLDQKLLQQRDRERYVTRNIWLERFTRDESIFPPKQDPMAIAEEQLFQPFSDPQSKVNAYIKKHMRKQVELTHVQLHHHHPTPAGHTHKGTGLDALFPRIEGEDDDIDSVSSDITAASNALTDADGNPLPAPSMDLFFAGQTNGLTETPAMKKKRERDLKRARRRAAEEREIQAVKEREKKEKEKRLRRASGQPEEGALPVYHKYIRASPRLARRHSVGDPCRMYARLAEHTFDLPRHALLKRRNSLPTLLDTLYVMPCKTSLDPDAPPTGPPPAISAGESGGTGIGQPVNARTHVQTSLGMYQLRHATVESLVDDFENKKNTYYSVNIPDTKGKDATSHTTAVGGPGKGMGSRMPSTVTVEGGGGKGKGGGKGGAGSVLSAQALKQQQQQQAVQRWQYDVSRIRKILGSSVLSPRLPSEINTLFTMPQRRRSLGEPERLLEQVNVQMNTRESFAKLLSLSTKDYALRRRRRSYDNGEYRDVQQGILQQMALDFEYQGDVEEGLTSAVTVTSLRNDSIWIEERLINAGYIEATEENKARVRERKKQMKAWGDAMKSLMKQNGGTPVPSTAPSGVPSPAQFASAAPSMKPSPQPTPPGSAGGVHASQNAMLIEDSSSVGTTSTSKSGLSRTKKTDAQSVGGGALVPISEEGETASWWDEGGGGGGGEGSVSDWQSLDLTVGYDEQQQALTIPKEGLEVWQEHYYQGESEGDSYWYYYNPATGESLWEMPQSGVDGREEVQVERMIYDESNEMYYWMNTTTGETRWMS